MAKGPGPQDAPHSRDSRRPSPAGRLRPSREQGQRFRALSVLGAFLRGGAHPGASAENRAVRRSRFGPDAPGLPAAPGAEPPRPGTIHRIDRNVRLDSSIGCYGKTQVNFSGQANNEVFRTQVKHPQDRKTLRNRATREGGAQASSGRARGEAARGPDPAPRFLRAFRFFLQAARALMVTGTESAPSGGCRSLGSGSTRPAPARPRRPAVSAALPSFLTVSVPRAPACPSHRLDILDSIYSQDRHPSA